MLHKLLTEHRGSCVDQTSTSSISESWPANTLSLAPTSTPRCPRGPHQLLRRAQGRAPEIGRLRRCQTRRSVLRRQRLE
ncbi:hypothetical protein B0H17DRAFT_159034 [Mycena rosella]|uniref:Uncharacterized protein n=1 Tax=Mycena rosella TaxID=1033263 RepID=A0AAD7GB64_MYCRO|nr:hypothetical protein B0H17DRAFT_159034 [Mycena rosella]